jgi:hypothetical protein
LLIPGKNRRVQGEKISISIGEAGREIRWSDLLEWSSLGEQERSLAMGMGWGERPRAGYSLYDRALQEDRGSFAVSSNSSTMTGDSLEVLGADGGPRRRVLEKVAEVAKGRG